MRITLPFSEPREALKQAWPTDLLGRAGREWWRHRSRVAIVLGFGPILALPDDREVLDIRDAARGSADLGRRLRTVMAVGR